MPVNAEQFDHVPVSVGKAGLGAGFRLLKDVAPQIKGALGVKLE